jgi:hypothetical protein
MPKRTIPIHASTFGGGLKDLLKDESKEARRTKVDGNIKSKILSHFVKGKISLTPMETIMINVKGVGILKGFCQTSYQKEICKNSSILGGCSHVYTHHYEGLHQQD